MKLAMAFAAVSIMTSPQAAADDLEIGAPSLKLSLLQRSPEAEVAGGAFQGEPDSAEAVQEAEIAAPFGSAQSWRLYVHGGGAVDVKTSDNALARAGIGFEHFIADDLSLNFEFTGLYVDQEGDDAVGGSFALLFRWHFISEETWSMYFDGGAGMLGTSSDVPDHGSSFNFTPQAGFGFTFDVGGDNRLMTGLRWYHISNANIYEENPGRDHICLYAGLSIPF